MEKYKHFITLKLQESLLLMAKYLYELNENQDYLQIPFYVNKIIQVAPKSLPRNSDILKFLNSTVNEIKIRLLTEFHSSFESHLVKSEELITDTNQKMMSWSEFLSTARELIISYSMISILPAYLEDSTHIKCIEAYQDCLDSAFTPLWGRFHFHLATARDSGSHEQILWTFEYSKSFVCLLHELCISITSPSSTTSSESIQERNVGLSQIFSPELMNSLQIAAIQQIVEKSCRFLRAHVASCISSIELSSGIVLSQFVVSILDCSLDLDSHFYSLLEDTVTKSATRNLPKVSYPLAISLVLLDHPVCKEIWITVDSDYYRNALLNATRPPPDLAFDDIPLALETDTSFEKNFTFHSSLEFNSAISSSPVSMPKSRCYLCIYECMYLFQLSSQRYTFLSRETYDIFISHVIEPILLTILGLMWFYKRMNVNLRDLDLRGVFPFYVQTSQQMEEYCGFIDTVNYIKENLLQFEEFYSRFICLTRNIPHRFEKILKLLKQWILDMTRGTKSQIFTLEDLVTKIYILCEQYQIKEREDPYNPMIGETVSFQTIINHVMEQLDKTVNELKEKIKIAEKVKNNFIY